MYKLYINIGRWIKVNKVPFYTEEEVVQVMMSCKNKYNNFYYMIVERIEDTDVNFTITRNEEDFNNYIQGVQDKYSNRIDDNLSAVELKRLILRGKKL